jgi:RNA polymerase sigma factor (sigma-70 family)
MSEAQRALLRRSLLSGYADLKARLARRLGSADLASEALHETWIRLQHHGDVAPVVNPEAYLFRAALNNATNLRRNEDRRLNNLEIDAILTLADDTPDAEQIAAGRQDIARLAHALEELTPRQQDIFRATFGEATSQAALADRHGVSLRTVQSDLHVAIRHCAHRLGRKSFFGSNSPEVSQKKRDRSH